MEELSRKLLTLKRAGFLQANIENMNLINLELLPLGRQLRAQIERRWEQSHNAADKQFSSANEDLDHGKNDVDQRLQFIFAEHFRKNMKLSMPLANFQTLNFKHKATNSRTNDCELIKFKLSDMGRAQLVSVNFFDEASGLAKLYSTQRERKIWWMRSSFDPSRYYLQPHKFTQQTKLASNAQSITIRSRLPIGDLDVEHITLARLADLDAEHKADIFRDYTGKKQLPIVIRSVIDLEIASCGLIFDAADNKKRYEDMFFNRKLAPYQCKVEIEGTCSAEIKDLSTHVSNVILRAGLRILNPDKFDVSNFNADQLGVPYTVIVSSDSLKTGLLKLRSRDTQLKETIHISDIPNYLLSIFSAR